MTSKLKLAIVSPGFYGQVRGGAELQLGYISQFARRSNIETHYVFVDRNRPYENVDDLILHPIPLKEKRGIKFLNYRNEIFRELEAIRPNVVISRHRSSWAWFANAGARRVNAKHVHMLASDRVNSLAQSWRDFLNPTGLLDSWYFCKTLHRVDLLVAQNAYQEEIGRRVYGKDALLLSQMTPLVPDEEIGSEQRDAVLWIANLKPLKRPEMFVELARRLRERKLSRPYRMIVCGRLGVYKELIDQAKKDCPEFEYLGEVSQDEVYRQLNRAIALVNTSEYEGFSNTFVQAWMRKVPVVSVNSDPDASLSKGGVGFMAPTMDELAEKTARLIEDAALRDEFGDKAREYAMKRHSLEYNMGRFFEKMEGMLE